MKEEIKNYSTDNAVCKGCAYRMYILYTVKSTNSE